MVRFKCDTILSSGSKSMVKNGKWTLDPRIRLSRYPASLVS